MDHELIIPVAPPKMDPDLFDLRVGRITEEEYNNKRKEDNYNGVSGNNSNSNV